jgi:hypothetical protein
MAQAENGGKPTTDFYHSSGTTGDPGANGWTVAQAENAGKPTTDFAHPSAAEFCGR